MKVRVVITVEMDDEAVTDWSLTYGKGTGPRAVAREVKETIGTAAQECAPFGSDEVKATITWE